MNVFEFVLIIVAITTIGGVLRARHGGRRWQRNEHVLMDRDDRDVAQENRRLIEEVQQLKDRVKVLERIAVEKEDTLSRQIEELRDR